MVGSRWCALRLTTCLASVWAQLSATFVLEVMVQLAVGVAHMHSCGILHRDLKADNALIQGLDPLVVKWGDYGCAVQLGKNVYGDGRQFCFAVLHEFVPLASSYRHLPGLEFYD